MSMQQIFLAQQPQEEIPITYAAGGPPPPPPGGGRELVRSYGPAKLPKARLAPFQGGVPPPAPGGATAPMPAPSIERKKLTRETVPIRRGYFPPRPEPAPVPPPPPPPAPPPPQRAKRKAAEQGIPVSLKPYRQPSGTGHRLPVTPSFVPFSGQAQRLPDENNLRANAIQRMRELGHQGMQARRGREMVDRMGDLGRAIRRGGQRGDVVGPGKRKREEEEFAPVPRRREGLRPAGPQMFSIAT